jgi:hypothetical protein
MNFQDKDFSADFEEAKVESVRKHDFKPWPKLDRAALHGIAGEFVRTLDPHTESDPVAVLVQYLVYFGNAVGRGPFYQIEGDRHYTNLMALLLGTTSLGRKGTSAGRVRQLFDIADPEWMKNRTDGGLSSGEGLIWAVRDPIISMKKGEPETIDEGVTDKRLLCDEREFVGVLTVAKREGNILSRVIRDAYDRGKLATMTKNSPARATGAHISIIGHITEQELKATLDSISIGNGLANRFLFNCVRRSKSLPHGGRLSDDKIQAMGINLKQALDAGRRVGRMEMSRQAHALWPEIYADLTRERTGIVASLTGRAAPHTIRLAVIYALLDGSPCIDVEHLKAAVAIWDYAEQSAKYVFDGTTGDKVADTILRMLRTTESGGLSRKQISDTLGRNRSAHEINEALTLLRAARLAEKRIVASDVGRPAEIWLAAKGD